MVHAFLKKILNHCLAPNECVNVAAYIRDSWIAEKAKTVATGSRVLDAGAGQSQYRHLFSHCDYKTQDFAQYQGTTSGTQVEAWSYSPLDYVSDITAIPVPDESFDMILCTEVLEHVPRPIEAVQELARILAPGGRLLLTAPFASGLHQQPFHFYGGFSPHFYHKFLTEAGLDIVGITPAGGLMRHVGQETHRVGRILEEKSPKRLSVVMKYILMCFLPRFLTKLDDEVFVEEFTVGYLVEACKRS